MIERDWLIIGGSPKGLEFLLDRKKDIETALVISEKDCNAIEVSPYFKSKNPQYSYEKKQRLVEINKKHFFKSIKIESTLKELTRKIPALEAFHEDISKLKEELLHFMEKFKSKNQLRDQDLLSESFWQLPPKLNQFYLSFYEQDERDTFTWESTFSFLSDGIFSIAQSEVHRRYLFISLLCPVSLLKSLPKGIEFMKEPIEKVEIHGLMGGFWEISIEGQKVRSRELILNNHFFWKQLHPVKSDETSELISSSWNRLVTNHPLSLPQGHNEDEALHFWKKNAFRQLLSLKPELKLATIQGIQKAYFAYPRAFYPLL